MAAIPPTLIHTGATSCTFKAHWPARFGPTSVLAVKVMRNVAGPDLHRRALAGFAFEAAMLSRAAHPNVVRLYGFCLEPPTVCLIMELLPRSLNRVLYSLKPAGADATPTAGDGHSSSGCGSEGSGSPRAAVQASDTSFSAAGGACGSAAGGCAVLPPHRLASERLQPRRVCPLSTLQLVQVVRDVAAGLAHLHATPDVRMPLLPGAHPDDSNVLARAMHRGKWGLGWREKQRWEFSTLHALL